MTQKRSFLFSTAKNNMINFIEETLNQNLLIQLVFEKNLSTLLSSLRFGIDGGICICDTDSDTKDYFCDPRRRCINFNTAHLRIPATTVALKFANY